jgi:hypothetical protein
MRSDRDQIRRAVQNGEGELARLYRRGVELGFAQVVQLGRQIRESVERERPANAISAEDRPVAAVSTEERSEDVVTALAIAKSSTVGAPTFEASPQAPVKQFSAARAAAGDVGAEPVAQANHAAGKPKPVTKKAAVIAFLKEILVGRGPVAANEIQRRAIDAGLLEVGAQIGKTRAFRDARASVGVITRQQRGGWVWSMPDQLNGVDKHLSKRHAEIAERRGGMTGSHIVRGTNVSGGVVPAEMAGVDQGHTKAAPYSQLIWDRRLDPERITLEQWIAYEGFDRQCGQWPDVGPRPGIARCEMPAELQKALGYTPVAPVR